MNGLSYILMIYMMDHGELADRLGENKCYVDNRVAGRYTIPKSYNEVLIEIFNIPAQYFNEELTKENMTYILNNIKSCGNITGLEYLLGVYGIQNKELAGVLGINKQLINMWKKRKQNISLKFVPVISEILGVPSNYLQKELTIEDMKDISKYIEIGKNIKFNKELEERVSISSRKFMKEINNRISINVSVDLLNKLENMSKEQHVSKQQQIIKILTDYFSSNSV